MFGFCFRVSVCGRFVVGSVDWGVGGFGLDVATLVGGVCLWVSCGVEVLCFRGYQVCSLAWSGVGFYFAWLFIVWLLFCFRGVVVVLYFSRGSCLRRDLGDVLGFLYVVIVVGVGLIVVGGFG